jgi:2-aminobenzoate-CoA ligase
MPRPTFHLPARYREIPPRLNMGAEIVDRPLELGWGVRTALWHAEGALSRDELRARVDACARGFRRLAIGRGTPYLLRGPNSPELVVAFLAGLKLGALPVLVNSLLGPRELGHIIENSAAEVAVVAAQAANPLRALQRERRVFRHLAVIGEGERDEPRLADLLDDDSSPLAAADTGCDEPAFMVYTSGTTGLPKGIVHSQRWVIAVGDLGVLRADYTPEDRVLATGEFSFISALGHGLVWPLRAGASAALLEERAQPEAVLSACERLGVTVLFSVPTFYRKVLTMPELEQAYPGLRLRYGNSTGEPLGVATYREWKARFGSDIYEYLGISEFQVLTCHGPAVPIRPGSVGVPFPGVDLRILDADLAEVGPGEEGYLSLRADDPGLCLGYRGNEQRWQQMFRDGWYQPGDRFRADADGYLWYVGREDDFFKSRGMSVAPAEIEAALMELAPVLEAAVVPVPDAEIGYAIKAVVVLRDGYTAAPRLADELRSALRERIAPYKVPRQVEFVTALPHSAQGKVLRRALQT